MRQRRCVNNSTASIWQYIAERRQEFLNPAYESVNDVLFPSCNLKNIHIFEPYFLRHDVSIMPPRPAKTFW